MPVTAGLFELGEWFEGKWLALHKRHPVCVHTLAGLMAKQRLLISEDQYFTDLHLRFVPLKDQYTIGGQYAKALRKALGQVVPPVMC